MDLKFLEFEQPIAELEAKIDALKFVGDDSEVNISDEIERLRKKRDSLPTTVFSSVPPCLVVGLARQPRRPDTLGDFGVCFTDFQELRGGGTYGDDHTLICRIGRLERHPVVIL